MSDDDDEDFSHVVVVTTKEVFSCVLRLEGFSKKRVDRLKKIDPLSSTTNRQRFKDHFGVSRVAAAQIWEDP